MELYGNDTVTIANGRLLADVRSQSVDGSLLAEVSDSDAWRFPFGANVPWILGGLLLVTIAGTACHMMPWPGGGSRTENFNYRIPPAWSPDNDNNSSFRNEVFDTAYRRVVRTAMEPVFINGALKSQQRDIRRKAFRKVIAAAVSAIFCLGLLGLQCGFLV